MNHDGSNSRRPDNAGQFTKDFQLPRLTAELARTNYQEIAVLAIYTDIALNTYAVPLMYNNNNGLFDIAANAGLPQ